MLTLNDGRAELWQWDTGRTLAVDADCSQVHFSNKVFGRSIDVDVVDGSAIIPDVLLQTDKDLNVWAFVGTAENGYTKISKTFKVNRRNKPDDYVFTPTDQMTLQMLQRQIGDISDLTTESKDTLVAAINEAARTGGGGANIALRVEGGYIQYTVDGITWSNLIAVADIKGAQGDTGKDGAPGKDGVAATIAVGTVSTGAAGSAAEVVNRGTSNAAVFDFKIPQGEPGKDGSPGKDGTEGANGITPTIGANGNWYLGDNDTGKPSTGPAGADGKSAYQYARDGGYTGTEEEFAAKLAAEMPDKLPNPNALTFTGAVTGSYDGSEAKTINIPSGGGEPEYDYEKTVVLGEAVASYIIDTFDDGTPLALSSLEVISVTTNNTASTVNICILTDLPYTAKGGKLSVSTTGGYTGAEKWMYCWLEAKIKNGECRADFSCQVGVTRYIQYYAGIAGSQAKLIPAITFNKGTTEIFPEKATKFTSVEIAVPAGSMESGSIIMIRGIKA